MNQPDLWNLAAKDWAEYQEPAFEPLWRAVLAAVRIRGGSMLLDAGCGAGGACRFAESRGAIATGIDASPEMIAAARRRMPRGNFRTGDIEHLPFPNLAFDAVTAINSLQFTSDPRAAASELGRVCRGNGCVVIAIFDSPQTCAVSAVTAGIQTLASTPSSGKGPFALSAPGHLESLIADPLRLDQVKLEHVGLEYPSLDAAARAFLAVGPSQHAAITYGHDRVAEAIRDALAPFAGPDGRVILENDFRLAVCRRV